MTGVVVFYEDRRSEAPQFGLHELVISLLADTGQGDRSAFAKRVEGIPCKSRDKLLPMVEAAARAEVRGRGRWVIGLLDRDKIADALPPPVPPGAPDEWIVEKLMARPGASDRQRFMLLRDNTESVLAALRSCDPSVDADDLHQAIKKRIPLYRDKLLGKAARHPDQRVRDCIGRAVPSLLQLRDVVLECVGTAKA